MSFNQSTSIQSVDVIHKFGREDISDVVFHVGDHKFHCHKMFLAVRSDFFAGMFCSSFRESNESSIKIDACPIAFKQLMEIIYNSKIKEEENLFYCAAHLKLKIENGDLNQMMWNRVSALFELADRFLLTDVVSLCVENAFLRYNYRCPHIKEGCLHCAVKLVLAMRYQLDDYKNINVTSRATVIDALERINGSVELSFDALATLLKRKYA